MAILLELRERLSHAGIPLVHPTSEHVVLANIFGATKNFSADAMTNPWLEMIVQEESIRADEWTFSFWERQQKPIGPVGEGANQVVTGTVVDTAGNSVNTSVTVKLDKALPNLTISSPSDGSTVSTASVTVSGTASDSLSGVTTVTCSGVQATVNGSNFSCIVSLSPGADAIPVLATDAAGNVSTATVNLILQSELPTITSVVAPAPNAAGWINANATVTFNCLGGTYSVSSCSSPVAVTTEGANQVVTGTVVDTNGNTVTKSVTINLDKTPPALAVASPSNGAVVSTASVNLSGTASDVLSGLASVTCGAVPATVSGSNFTCGVSLTLGLNSITVQATDIAGNVSTTTLNVTFQIIPPVITAGVSPSPNAAGWNNSSATVTFTCTPGSYAIATCTSPVTVSTETASQVVLGTVVDTAGNTASKSVTVKLDKTPPALGITSPSSGSTVAATSQSISGTVSDSLSGLSSITCNGAAATLNGTSFSCGITLTLGLNSIAVRATDIAGNASTSNLPITYAPVPQVTITSPVNLGYLNITPTTVNGTVSDPTATVVVNGISAPQSSGPFSVTMPLAEGPNILSATATSALGAVGTASISVTLDTTPPHITITSPPNQFVTTDASISIAGNVNDIVVGTVNSQQAAVTVNASPAQVANRTFLASNVSLNLGSNVIQAVATDRAGNAATTQIIVTRQAPAAQPKIQLISGNNQTGTIGTVLAAPLVVALTDSLGSPVANKPVIFKVTQNNGMISAGGTAAPSAIATTNSQGQAQVNWTLGMRSGAGGNTVEAYAVGFGETAIFNATGNQGPAGLIVVDSGNSQIGAAGQPLPLPLIAVVVDAGNNRLAGVPVTFTVVQGGGSLDVADSSNFTLNPAGSGATSITVTSDSDGRVAATLTLGLQEGNANNLVTADFPGDQGVAANFTASGRVSCAVEWKLVRENPARGIRLFKRENRRLRYLTKEQIQDLLKTLKGVARIVVLTALHTGMRKGELLGLRWEDVDWLSGSVHVRKSKNGEDRFVPMDSVLVAELKTWFRAKRSEFVFTWPNGRRVLDMRETFNSTLSKLKIADFRFHDLRHTFASHFMMSGGDLYTLKEILGHKTVMMTQRYAHLSQTHKREVAKVMDTFWTLPAVLEKPSAQPVSAIH